MGHEAIGRLVSVNVGRPREVDYKGRKRTTAIWKTPVSGRVRVSGVNLEGDDQADRKVHGGERKAVYSYGIEDYRWWSDQLGFALQPGTFGENLTCEGIDYGQVRPTERWQVGNAVLQVTQPRVPCWKLGARMNDPRFPKRFLQAARTGAYLTIVEPGYLESGDEVRLVHRPDIPLTIAVLGALNAHDPTLSGLLMQLAEQGLDPQEWPPLMEAVRAALGGSELEEVPAEES
ncbi:MAG: MOSC domain-containing protein [Actinomycetota bacterium]